MITSLPALQDLQKRSRAQDLRGHNVLPSLSMGRGLRTFTSNSTALNRSAPLRSEFEEDEEEEEDFNPWADLDDSTTEWERGQSKPGTLRPAQADTSASKEPSTSSDQTHGAMKLSEEEKMWLAAVSAKLERDAGSSEGQTRRQRQRQQQHASAQGLEYSPTPRIVYPPPHSGEFVHEEPRARSSPPRAAAPAQPTRLTHLDASTHQPSMVNVSSKPNTLRTATAVGKVFLPWSCLDLLSTSSSASKAEGDRIGEVDSPAGKGPVFTTARLAGVMAAKRTAEWVPLCHSVPLDGCEILFDLVIPSSYSSSSSGSGFSSAPLPYISIRATTTTRSATGVEMEALVAVQAAATTVWDMLKSVAGKEMHVGEIMVLQKSGGKSGDWVREEEVD